jgi:hypothetical protein
MGMVLCLRGATEQDLAGLRADTNAADDFLFDDDAYRAGELIDFDKAWNALQFMFTGSDAESDHPLSFFPYNPERIGTDNGYGGPWVFTPTQVKAFNSALTELSDEELESRYDPTEMVKHDVYLADSLVDDGPEGLEYVMQSVPALRALVERCAANGSSMIGMIT